jgi:hypothetical protein
MYTTQQIYMWALLHAFFLNWAVRFPVSYRQLRTSVRIRYAHIISVVLAVTLPLVSPCVILKDGYLTVASEALFCVGRNFDLNYYAVILPASLLIGMTLFLLVFLFWTLFKVFINPAGTIIIGRN